MTFCGFSNLARALSTPLRFALVGLALCATLAVFSVNSGNAGVKSFATGTLIIPMDTDTAANHASFNQNNGMWKAYGLVYRLLQNGIPVQWAIDTSKASTSGIDFSASSVSDQRTGTSLGSWDYRGGPFIIDSAHAAQALPIINAWWAANGNQPNVHTATASFSANVPLIMTQAPRIANEAINSSITSAYYNAAGIPDAAGNPWSSTSPNILNETQIANGALFNHGAVCDQAKYTIFVTPHNSGYLYSLTDPTNLGTKTYGQLDTFVSQGGGWTAMCHSILSNENAIAALTTNGSASVKALFPSSQPGGTPGGLLTTTGFPLIDNTGGTWSNLLPGYPAAQAVPTTVAQSLPGGSVQTWPAPGNPGAPTYYPSTKRAGTFTASGVSHDDFLTGIYHNGTGEGRITYIGGHSFTTTLPYSANAEAPFLRAFYNSLLFNGAGEARLDLTLDSTTYPQNGTGLLDMSIKNVGGDTASNVASLGVTLAPGITYAGTTSGPAPQVSGQTLVWPSGVGDIAGGATAVSFQVSVDPSVSATIGSKHLGDMSATFTDDFGGKFTAGVCKDVTIAAAPVPVLTKTPASQSGFNPGDPVTWTLHYGNNGGGALTGSTVQDTLPAGFTYVSSSSTPSLGAPTVIPGTQTTLRWSTGTLAVNTPAAGTITVVARAGQVTNGTGTPPTQTFTNNATLTGTGAGAQFSTSASATVDVQALPISLGKTVDHTFLSSLPGSALYTMTPRSADDSALSNVRVVDPVPAGVTSPSAGQGGTVGPYTPLAAVGGDDGAGLTTSIAVSSNLVTSGTSVTVSLTVKDSSNTDANVTPGSMTATGGPSTCGSPSPASATVPAGATGVTFTFSCTTDSLGEYVFSDDASDGSTNNWPAASSASVLSTAGGGPNVAVWNLGSNTAAVPGQVITSGTSSGVFALQGANTKTFQKFDIGANTWGAKTSTTTNVSTGGALTSDGAGTLYALGGNNGQTFYSYSVAGNTWATKATTGTNVGDGGSLVYLNNFVYATMGNNTKTFKRYDVGANTWSAMTNVPQNVKGGGSLTTDGTNLYLVNGNNGNVFDRYNVAANTWTKLANVSTGAAGPAGTVNVNSGGASVFLGGYVYTLAGNGKNTFVRYSVAGNTWSARANAPGAVKAGGSLTTDGTYLYAFQGSTKAFWRFDPAANKWTALPSVAANTGGGGSLAYVASANEQGRFTSFDVSNSLGVTGDQVDVTLSVSSSTEIDGIGAGTLTVTPTNASSCSTLSGPTLTSSDNNSTGTNDPVTYTWTCTLAAGTNPGSLTFSDSTVVGTSPAIGFPTATSMSVLVSPPLTMSVTVPNGAPNPVQDTGLLITDGGSAASPTTSTYIGSPAFTITKATDPDSSTILHPGDPITYTVTVQNSGTGIATNAVVSDTLPAQVNYVSCAGGSSCNNSAGMVTWNVGTLNPGDTATVSVTVATTTGLPVSDTPYTISNTASVTSTEVGSPTTSNTVTNQLQVLPTVVKTVSTPDAGPGDTITYTVNVQNPGAAFTATLTDPIPTGASYAGNCSPACSFASGTVSWSGVTIQSGANTFSFDATITATGGSTVTNQATLDPTSPDLVPEPSNSVDTDIGPSLSIAKFGDKIGLVNPGDVITYTLAVGNESAVAATGVTATDPVPAGTSYVANSCSTAAGSCSFSNGSVDFNLGPVAGSSTQYMSFQVLVGTGTLQISNVAHVSATNSPNTVDSNEVDNALATYPLTASIASGQGTITSDVGAISCADNGGTCNDTYGAGTVVTLTAAGRNGQQFTGWSGDCAGTSPTCQVTMSQARNVSASFATPPPGPDLVLSKTHSGSFTQAGTGSYSLDASNIGGSATSGTVTVTEAPPSGLTVTGLSGTGWTCTLGALSCSRSDALSVGAHYPLITVTVDVAFDAPASLTNDASVAGGGETNTANDDASDVTAITPAAILPDLTIAKSHTGDFVQGGIGTYKLDVSNVGSDASSGTVTVTDNPPASLTITDMSGTGWSCTVATATCTRSDALAAGDSYPTITVTVGVDGNAPTSVTNEADVSGGSDVNPANNSASDDTTIDLQQFPLDVTVDGHGSVTGDVGSVDCVDNAGTCSDSYDNGTKVTLVASAGANYNFTGWSGACTGSTTTCQVTMDQARDVTATFVVYKPDLVVAKTHTGNFTQGGTGSYSITVSNEGGDPSYGAVTVTDTPPTGLTITGLSGSGWTCTLGTLSCTRSDALAAGDSYPAITVDVTVGGNAPASLTNHADVSGGGDVDLTNNSADDPTTIDPQQFPLDVTVVGQGTVTSDVGSVDCVNNTGTCSDDYDNGTKVTLTADPAAHYNFTGWTGDCTGSSTTCQVTMDQARDVTATFTVFQPDLTIAKSHTGNFTQGGTGAYTLSVSNAGDDPSYGTVTAVDNPPASLTVTGMNGTGWSCTVATATCTRSDALAAGDSYPDITVTVSVDGNAPASVTNNATVSGGGDVNLANNSADDPTTIDPQQFPLDVTVVGQGSVTSDVGAVNCVDNAGTCSDNYDNGTKVTLTAIPDTNYNFTGWSGACSGSSTTCQVTMDQARSVTATFTVFQPDLTIAKSHTGNFTQGGTGAYTLSVSNAGDDPSYGTVTAVDNPPASLTVTDMSGTGWSCTVATATCTRSDALAPGDSYPDVTVTVSVDGNAPASVTNNADVSGGGDVDLTNNTADDPTTIDPQQFPLTTTVVGHGTVSSDVGAVNCVDNGGTCSDDYDNGTKVTLTESPGTNYVFTGWSGDCSGSDTTCQVTMDQARDVTATFSVLEPDLTIAKSHTGNFVQGGTGSYSLDVSNIGAIATSGTVTATDTPPTGLTITGLSGTGWTCTLGTLSCSRSDALAAGDSYPTITVTVDVASNAPASVTNNASVSGGGESNTANDSASDQTTITPVWPLTVSVTGSGSVDAEKGAVAGCTASSGVCNDTYTDGTDVTLTETPGAHHNFTGWGGACSGTATTCKVTMDQARNVTATFAIYQPDLTIAKSHTGNFVQGGTGTYTLTVSNAGDDPSYGTVTAVDNPPASLTVTDMSGTGWNCTVATATCTRSDALSADDSYPDITVTVSVDGDAPASVTNHATVSGGGDVNPDNNDASDDTTVDPQQFPLTTTVVGNGTVTTDVGGIDCTSASGTCNHDYDNGTAVTLTATPDSGNTFDGWTGDCSGASTTCQVTMDQARDVTATFVSATAPHTLTVKLAGLGHGRADSNPAGIACGSDCVETYTNGTVVTLTATAKKRSAFKGFTGCDTVAQNTCTVTLSSDRLVVVTFDPNPWLKLRIPSRYVLHAPYDKAKMKAYVERNGKPLKGVKVNVTVRCAGQKTTHHHGKTNRKGVMRFSEARDMPNAVRLLTCRVLATAKVGHRKLKAHGRVRFIHPYWLKVAKQAKDGSHVVIRAFARPGWTFSVYDNRTKVVRKAKAGKNGWVTISLPTARPGDLIWLKGINHHYFSHVVILGRTPGTATVETDEPHSKR
jgi:uncharacterized repeat protein (TIGR01451 family)/uncharacterized repeat protein (TIGR02543 family)